MRPGPARQGNVTQRVASRWQPATFSQCPHQATAADAATARRYCCCCCGSLSGSVRSSFFPLSIYLLIIFFFCVRSLATPAALLSVFFTWFSAWRFIKKIIYKEKRSRSVCIYLLEPVRNARLSLRIFQFPTWDIYRIFFWNSTQHNTHTHRHEEFCKLKYTQ